MPPDRPPAPVPKPRWLTTLLFVAAISTYGCDGPRPVAPAKSSGAVGKQSNAGTRGSAPRRTLDTLEAQVRALNERLGHLPRLLSAPNDRSLRLRTAEKFEGLLPPEHRIPGRSPLTFDEFAQEVDKRWDISAKKETTCRVKVRDVAAPANEPDWWSADVSFNCRTLQANAPPCVSSARAKVAVKVERGPWVVGQLTMEEAYRNCPRATRFVDKTETMGLRHLGLPFAKQGREAMNWQGVGSADVNGDGRWDIFVPGRDRNRLYLNTVKSGFVEVAEPWGVAEPPGGTGVVFFDFDNDGDQDLFVGHPGAAPTTAQTGIRAYENVENKHFADRSRELGFTTAHAAYPLVAFDANDDGFVDLYVGGYGHLLSESNNSWIHATNGAADALYLNRGGTSFGLAGQNTGIGGDAFTYAAAAADVDRDGRLDLYAGNDFAPNALMLNHEDGRFRDDTSAWRAAAPGNAMGVTFADFDSDGHLDLIVTHMASSAGERILRHVAPELERGEHQSIAAFAAGNAVLLRRGSGYKALAPGSVGVDSGWAWGPAVADFDLDGDLDLYVVNGYVTGESEHDT